MALGILSDGMFALVAGAAGDFLRRNRRFLRLQRWFAGTSFIGLGITAALATRKYPASDIGDRTSHGLA
jgi:threonine/homoserine/homoserine lactone efflux protein